MIEGCVDYVGREKSVEIMFRQVSRIEIMKVYLGYNRKADCLVLQNLTCLMIMSIPSEKELATAKREN